MRKLTVILMVSVAMLFAGLLAWNAEAIAMSGVGGDAAKAYTPIVQDIGCRRNAPLIGENGCRRGTHQVCKKKTGCLCIPC
jgi:hypothetical protein